MTTPTEAFAQRMGIEGHQVRRLVTLVEMAAKAQEGEHGSPTINANRYCSQVDNYARKLGLGTDWRPGIYPLFTKGELSEHLPD